MTKNRRGTLEKDKKPTARKIITDNPGASRYPSRKFGGPAWVRNHFKTSVFPSLRMALRTTVGAVTPRK